MKKLGKYFFIGLLSVIIFLFGFNHKDNKQPNTLYRVYLDQELIGTIESREDLEDYINNQANVIRENLKKYTLRVESIETFLSYNNVPDIQNYEDSEKVNYLIANKDALNISETDLEDLKFYKQEKLYNINELELQEMKNYILENEIYLHVEDVYTPNGIEIKKVYTYENDTLTVAEIYKRIMTKKSCSIAGYKFTIKSDNDEIDDIVVYTLDTEIFSKADISSPISFAAQARPFQIIMPLCPLLPPVIATSRTASSEVTGITGYALLTADAVEPALLTQTS